MSTSFLPRLSKLLVLGACVIIMAACADSPTEPGGCTEIGCGSAFSVNIQRTSAWQAGAYTVEVTADGVKTTCTATFPLSCDAPAACPAGSKVLLGLSGCALDPSQQSLSGVEFEQGQSPASIAISVLFNGAPLGNGTFSPVYTQSTPNGEGCGPTCNSAPSASLPLP